MEVLSNSNEIIPLPTQLNLRRRFLGNELVLNDMKDLHVVIT